jgi:hypothetical protein
MRVRNYQILTERTLDSDPDFIALRYNHRDLGDAYEIFVDRLFEIASPYDLTYEDRNVDSDADY